MTADKESPLSVMNRWCLLPVSFVFAFAASATAIAADSDAGHAAPGIREDLSLWGAVAFVVFFLACVKLLGGWARQSLAEREMTENDLISQAEQKNRAAQEQLTQHRGRMEAIAEEIDERLAEARRDADYTRGEILAVARRESELLQTRVRNEIHRTRDQALNDLFSTMAAKVVEKAEVNLRQGLSNDEHNRLIDEALTHFTRS